MTAAPGPADVPLGVERRPVTGGHLVVLTLDRPDARNALDTGLLAALVDALHDADADPGLRGLVLTGAGGVFCAGADLREPVADGGRRQRELFTTAIEQLTLLRVPTVAAVEGPAVGGGAEAAAACDVRIAAVSAHLRFAGAVHGVPVGTARTIGQVGLATARDWVLSSRVVPADEAERRGFVQQLVEDGGAVPAALAWLEEVARRDAPTVALLKRLFVEHSGLRDRVAFENDAIRAQLETGQLPSLDRDLPRTVRPRQR